MAASSITHNFVIKDKTSAEKLANALSMPKKEEKKATAKMVTGRDALTLLMNKWRNGR